MTQGSANGLRETPSTVRLDPAADPTKKAKDPIAFVGSFTTA